MWKEEVPFKLKLIGNSIFKQDRKIDERKLKARAPSLQIQVQQGKTVN